MDPRKILGVSDGAGLDEIQKAYRKQARKHHPDLGGDAWAFQQVQDAYEKLTNPTKAKKSKSPESKTPRRQRPTAPADSGRSRTAEAKRPKTRANSEANQKANRGSAKSRTKSKSRSKSSVRRKKQESMPWSKLLSKDLPLQSLTSIFILLNCLDVFMTYILLNRPRAFEANPIANYFLQMWGFHGMVVFKLVIVAIVCVIAQIVALKKLRLAQFLLIAGSVTVGYVVVYSARLYVRHFM